jgi:hypothetical protein
MPQTTCLDCRRMRREVDEAPEALAWPVTPETPAPPSEYQYRLSILRAHLREHADEAHAMRREG